MMLLFLPGWGWRALVLALVSATTYCHAQDKIVLSNGETHQGKILKVENGMVQLKVPQGLLPLRLDQIQAIDMAPPAVIKEAANLPPKQVITKIGPLIQQFDGLPAAWLVDAMGQLASAYSDSGQTDKALVLYQQIQEKFPNSRFELVATTGIAREEVKKGNTRKALNLLKPVIKASNQKLMPTSEDSKLFGRAYLVQGQALEKAGRLNEALESYLAVTTIFYHNSRAVAEANKRAAALRQKHPDAMVQ